MRTPLLLFTGCALLAGCVDQPNKLTPTPLSDGGFGIQLQHFDILPGQFSLEVSKPGHHPGPNAA